MFNNTSPKAYFPWNRKNGNVPDKPLSDRSRDKRLFHETGLVNRCAIAPLRRFDDALMILILLQVLEAPYQSENWILKIEQLNYSEQPTLWG